MHFRTEIISSGTWISLPSSPALSVYIASVRYRALQFLISNQLLQLSQACQFEIFITLRSLPCSTGAACELQFCCRLSAPRSFDFPHGFAGVPCLFKSTCHPNWATPFLPVPTWARGGVLALELSRGVKNVSIVMHGLTSPFSTSPRRFFGFYTKKSI